MNGQGWIATVKVDNGNTHMAWNDTLDDAVLWIECQQALGIVEAQAAEAPEADYLIEIGAEIDD